MPSQSSQPADATQRLQAAPESSNSPVIDLIDSRMPGFKGADRRNRWKIITLTTALFFIATLATSYFQFGFNLFTLRATASAEDAANDVIEAGKPAFTMNVDSRTESSDILSADTLILFKDPLTMREQKELMRLRYLDTNSGVDLTKRVLALFDKKASLVFSDGADSENRPKRMITPLQLTLQSTRSSSITIRGIDATNIKCRTTDISAVIYIPPQGGEAVERVTIDLASTGDSTPLMENKVVQMADHREVRAPLPYFSEKFVELGNGQASWAANLDAMALNQQCQWDLKFSYIDSGEKKTSTQKSPLFRTQGYPAEPSQLFEFLPSVKGNGLDSTCWGEKIDKTTPCDFRAPRDDRTRKDSKIYYWDAPR
jgi:hypothetical protein